MCQDPKLDVSHSCHDVIDPDVKEDAQDTMRENTETKQGSTVDKASQAS